MTLPVRGVVPESSSEDEDISLDQLLTPLRRQRRLVIGIPVACALVTGLVSLVLPPVYSARTTFIPEAPTPGTNLSQGLAGLAGALGITSALLSNQSQSPDFFAEVLRSRHVLHATLLTKFPDPAGPDRPPLTLLDHLKVKEGSPEQRLERGARLLEKKIDPTLDRRTGIVTLTVEQPSRELAAAVANRMVELLNKFNLERRQFQSREQKRFTGERLVEAEQELRQAEHAQLRFLQSNRHYIGSPLLEAEAARHDRNVRIKQETYLMLSQAYEEARIAEVRDTPALTVIDTAVAPDMRTSPRRLLNATVALLLGSLVGVAAAFLAEYLRRHRYPPPPMRPMAGAR